jgi:hypothetical protein
MLNCFNIGKLTNIIHHIISKPSTVVHTCESRSGEAKVGGLRVRGQPGLHSEFQATLAYIMKPNLKKMQNKGRGEERRLIN